MKLKLIEKSVYDYIYVDKKNKVHILVPLSAGEVIGRDNTCKATVEIKGFLEKIGNVLNRYVSDLKHDISYLEENRLFPEQQAAKEERLKQLVSYQEVMLRILTAELIDSFNHNFPSFPEPILKALASPDSNAVGVRLAPSQCDNYMRITERDPLFALTRITDTFSPYVTDHYQRRAPKSLRALFPPIINYVLAANPMPNFKDRLVQTICDKVALSKISNQKDFEQLKSVFLSALHEAGITDFSLDQTSSGQAIDYNYFITDMWMDDMAPLNEWVLTVASTIHDSVFKGLINSPFKMPKNSYDPFMTSQEMFFIKVQLFLAITNAFHYEITGIRKDFGKILEQNTDLTTDLLAHIRLGIINNYNVEESIFDFFDKHIGSLSSKKTFFHEKLTTEAKNEMKRTFFLAWSPIELSPHFDEFLLKLSTKGDFFGYRSTISLDMARYVKEHDKRLYNKHFVKGLLSHQIPSDEIPEDGTELPCSNQAVLVEVDFNTDEFLTLSSSSIAQILMVEVVGGSTVLEQLTPETVEKIKARPDWSTLLEKIIKSESNQELIDKFTEKFNLPGYFVLEFEMVQAIYTLFSLKYADSSAENPLSSLSGIKKLQHALNLSEIKIDHVEFNAEGKFVIQYDRKDKEKLYGLLPSIKSHENIFHLTSQMAPVFYLIAQSLDPAVTPILSTLNNQGDPSKSKMARTLQTVLDIDSSHIISSGEPAAGQILVRYYNSNGYLIKADIELIRRLEARYRQHLTVVLNSDQIFALLMQADLDPTMLTVENLHNALLAREIAFFGVQQIGTNWVVVCEYEKDKKKLLEMTPEKVAEIKGAYQHQQNKEKAKHIAELFGTATLMLDEAEASGFVFSFKTDEERKQFATVMVKIVSEYLAHDRADDAEFKTSSFMQNYGIKEPEKNPITLPGSLIERLEDVDIIVAGSHLPLFRDRVVELAEKFGQALKDKELDIKAHSIVSSVSKTDFIYNINTAHEREFAHYLLTNFNNYCELTVNEIGYRLQVSPRVFFKLDIDQAAEAINQRFRRHFDLIKPVLTTSPHVDESKIDYKIVTNDSVIAQARKYKQALEQHLIQPGLYLAERLVAHKMSVEQLTLEQFIDAIFQTKIPRIFAESEVLGNGLDWNQEELALLGSLNVVVKTTFFDNGAYVNPEIFAEPYEGYLAYTPGILLATSHLGTFSPDRVAVVKRNWENDELYIDEEAFYQLYRERLLPLLLEASQTMVSQGSQAELVLPGLGCGQFAGPFKGKLGPYLLKVLTRLLEENVKDLPGINTVHFDPFNECDNSTLHIGHITFNCRPLSKGAGKAQLASPAPGLVKYALVAWDHCSWPTNDNIVGTRITDDGVKGAASNTLEIILGYPGHYDASNAVMPMFKAKDYRTWEECIFTEGLRLPALNRLYVVEPEKKQVVKFERDGHFYVSAFMVKALMENPEEFQAMESLPMVAREAKLKDFLQSHFEVESVKQHGTTGFDVVMLNEEFNKLTQKVGCLYHLKAVDARALYHLVKKMGEDSQIASISTLSDCNKIKKTLSLLGINYNAVQFHRGESISSIMDGYDLLIPADQLKLLQQQIEKFYQDDFPQIKKEVINSLALVKIDQKISRLSFLGKKNKESENPRIIALIESVKNTDNMNQVLLILENQLALAQMASLPLPENLRVPEVLCATRWTATYEAMPSSREYTTILKSEIENVKTALVCLPPVKEESKPTVTSP